MLTDVLSTENIPFELKNDARDCCPKYFHKWFFGIAYIDPPMTKKSLLITKQLINDFAKYCPQVDIVFYVGAAYIKRFTGMGHVPFDKELIEFMHPNKDWVIRTPFGQSQFTFLVGTKITKDLSWASWSNEGFYKVDSYDGQRILKRLNYIEPKPIVETYGMVQGKMF